MILRTTDILGATAGSKGLGVFADFHKRKDFRSVNQTEDIEGAQAGSLKRGTQTKRVTNPLDPVYQIPGSTELFDPMSAFSKTKNEFRKSTSSIQQITAKEALKKTVLVPSLEVIPEKTAE